MTHTVYCHRRGSPPLPRRQLGRGSSSLDPRPFYSRFPELYSQQEIDEMSRSPRGWLRWGVMRRPTSPGATYSTQDVAAGMVAVFLLYHITSETLWHFAGEGWAVVLTWIAGGY